MVQLYTPGSSPAHLRGGAEASGCGEAYGLSAYSILTPADFETLEQSPGLDEIREGCGGMQPLCVYVDRLS